MHTARMHGRTKTCLKHILCLKPFQMNTQKKRERKKRAKRWISSRSVHSTHSSVVINRSILIYMARSQFAVLNMLVLYFRPKHVKWEFFFAIYWQGNCQTRSTTVCFWVECHSFFRLLKHWIEFMIIFVSKFSEY